MARSGFVVGLWRAEAGRLSFGAVPLIGFGVPSRRGAAGVARPWHRPPFSLRAWPRGFPRRFLTMPPATIANLADNGEGGRYRPNRRGSPASQGGRDATRLPQP